MFSIWFSGACMQQTKSRGSMPCVCVGLWEQCRLCVCYHIKGTCVSVMNTLAHGLMMDAAKCDAHCELQFSVNELFSERIVWSFGYCRGRAIFMLVFVNLVLHAKCDACLHWLDLLDAILRHSTLNNYCMCFANHMCECW